MTHAYPTLTAYVIVRDNKFLLEPDLDSHKPMP